MATTRPTISAPEDPPRPDAYMSELFRGQVPSHAGRCNPFHHDLVTTVRAVRLVALKGAGSNTQRSEVDRDSTTEG